MANRVLVALVVAVGLAGCGGTAESEKGTEGMTYPNATVTHGPGSTFTLKSQGKTISDIKSFQVSDQSRSPGQVEAFIAQEDQVGDTKLCCESCSYSGGTLICTGCTPC